MNLKFVICGMEHTGTTLVSDLFRQVPGLDSGFEVGVLLRDTPAEFQNLKPFSDNILQGWGITQEQFAHCCAGGDHLDFYARLQEASTSLKADTRAIFDKTPRYVAQLAACMTKVEVPFIVTHKDPRAIVASDFKRAKTQDFNGWYDDYMPRKRTYMTNCYREWEAAAEKPRVFRIGLEDLAMNARLSMEGMFAHAGFEFSLDYAVMKDLRFKNTRANFVSAEIAFEYPKILPRGAENRIITDFAAMDRWFYQ